MNKLFSTAIFTVVMGLGTESYSATCPSGGVDRFMEFTPNLTCVDSGTQPTSEKEFLGNNSEYTFFDKIDNGTGGSIEGFSFDSQNGRIGTVDYTPFSDDAFAVLFKVGNPNISNSWFAFELPSSGLENAIWKLQDADGSPWKKGGSLSHVTLFSKEDVSVAPVPLPAAGFLLLMSLLGLVTLRRKA